MKEEFRFFNEKTDVSEYERVFLRELSQIEIINSCVGKQAQAICHLCNTIRISMSKTHPAMEYRGTRVPPIVRKIANTSTSSTPMMPAELWAMVLAKTRDEVEDPKTFMRRVLDRHLCGKPIEHEAERGNRVDYEMACLTTLTNLLQEQRVINIPQQFQNSQLETKYMERSDEFILACKINLRSRPIQTNYNMENIFQFTMNYRFPNEPVTRHIYIHFNATLSEFYQLKFRYGRIQASRVYGFAEYVLLTRLTLVQENLTKLTRVRLNQGNIIVLLQEVNFTTDVLNTFKRITLCLKDPRFLQDTKVSGSYPVGGFEPWSEYSTDYFRGFS